MHIYGGELNMSNIRIHYSFADFKTRDMSYLSNCNIQKKEFFESKETIDKSIKYITRHLKISKLNVIYDICAGHSFTCLYALSRNYAKYAISIDIKHPQSCDRILSFYPQLFGRISYIQNDIYKTNHKTLPNSMIVGIHPCKGLAFRIAEIAIQNKCPCVIVPCCASGTQKKSWIDSFPDLSEYHRYTMRIVEMLSSNGFEITIKTINPKYTPKNYIIIGIPNIK